MIKVKNDFENIRVMQSLTLKVVPVRKKDERDAEN